MAMKRYTILEYIHGNIVPGKGKEKDYILKMLIDEPRKGINLVKRM
jgi:hypothetical protein